MKHKAKIIKAIRANWTPDPDTFTISTKEVKLIKKVDNVLFGKINESKVVFYTTGDQIICHYIMAYRIDPSITPDTFLKLYPTIFKAYKIK